MDLVGKSKRKRPLVSPTRKWDHNTKMDLQQTGWDGVESIDLVQDIEKKRALVNAVMNLRVP